MTDYLLFSKILLRRLNHFGYGEEKLRCDNGGNNPHKNWRKIIVSACNNWGIGSVRRWRSNKPYNADNYHYQTDNHGNIAEDFKEATRAIKRLKKFYHSFFACKGTEFSAMA